MTTLTSEFGPSDGNEIPAAPPTTPYPDPTPGPVETAETGTFVGQGTSEIRDIDDEPDDEFDRDVAEDADPPAPPEPEHEAVPDDALDEPPRDDELNLKGYFRRPAGAEKPPGSTTIVTLDATPNAIAVYGAKGWTFEGYVPDPTPAPSVPAHTHDDE